MNNMTCGKIVISGEIKTISPLHMGCGENEKTDMDILLDAKGLPFIPATAFIGVLRHMIDDRFPEVNAKEADRFWGYARGDDNASQSSIRCDDLGFLKPAKGRQPNITIRDGICIDNKTGLVKYQGKYDYEVLERGAVFSFNLEFDFNENNADFIKKMAATIYHMLGQNQAKDGSETYNPGLIRLGAKTNNGLGEIRMIPENTAIFLFDFRKKNHVCNWLSNRFPKENLIDISSLGKPFEPTGKNLTIEVTLFLKNSLIIRSYPSDPDLPDAVHIKSLDDWVLTGSSLKGAIRSRVERIVNTMGKNPDMIDKLFGFVKENTENNKAGKGRVRVRETILPKFEAELQNRIKIDRFTGGTIDGALFDSMPLFWSHDDKALKVIMEVENCRDAEAGLMLLILKDLWTGDLAVGGEKNVGRGVFQGRTAIITINDQKFILDKNLGSPKDQDTQMLENYVKAFNKEK